MDHFPMRNQAPTPHNPQSGSIFIWIFVMIALFAAFSFAVSQGSRTGASSLTDQQAKMLGTEIVDFGRQVKDTINTLRLNNNCTLATLNFEGAAGGTYTNGAAPSDGSCDVFGAGGKLRLPDFGDDLADDRLVFVGNHVQSEGGTAFLGTSEPDLTMVREVDANTCGAINKLLANPTEFWDGYSGSKVRMWESAGDHNGQRDQTTDNFSNFAPYDGSFSSTGGRGIRFRDGMTFNGASYAGRVPPMTGCFCDSTGNCEPPVKYYFYNVLWVR